MDKAPQNKEKILKNPNRLDNRNARELESS